MYSRLSISQTRISGILRNLKHLSESKKILIALSNHNLAFETFLQVKITRSANKFALRVIWTCKKISNTKFLFEKAIKLYFWSDRRFELRRIRDIRVRDIRVWDIESQLYFKSFQIYIYTSLQYCTVMGVFILCDYYIDYCLHFIRSYLTLSHFIRSYLTLSISFENKINLY